MRLDRTSNPVFKSTLFETATAETTVAERFSIGGVINKTTILFLITLLTTIYAWKKVEVGLGTGLIWVGVIGGLVFGIITAFSPRKAVYFAPIYAAFEGLFIGAVSYWFESMVPGIVLRAVLLTFGVMFTVLFLYRIGVLKATAKFVKVIIIATAGIAVYYLLMLILSFFGIDISTSNLGVWGIVIQGVIVLIAALNFVLDFAAIESYAEAGVEKRLEWYAAFGLLVTLIWLYIEILKLLAQLAGRQE